MFSSSDEEEGN
jgi:hypothetical protein